MVIMVRSLQSVEIDAALSAFRWGETVFTGPRAFRRWPVAVAYALLEPAPGVARARRRVYRLGDGRWGVISTLRPAAGRPPLAWTEGAPHRPGCPCVRCALARPA